MKINKYFKKLSLALAVVMGLSSTSGIVTNVYGEDSTPVDIKDSSWNVKISSVYDEDGNRKPLEGEITGSERIIGLFYKDGKPAFCVEPGIATYADKEYNGKVFINSNEKLGAGFVTNVERDKELTSEQKVKIAKYAYYASDLYSKATNDEDRIAIFSAGQTLVWKSVGVQFKENLTDTEEYTSKFTKGYEDITTNVKAKMADIEKAINEETKKWYVPTLSFNGGNVTNNTIATTADTLKNGITISDSGAKLSDYYEIDTISDSANFEATINGNDIKITPKVGTTITEAVDLTIKLKGKADKLLPLHDVVLAVENGEDTYQRLVTYSTGSGGSPLALRITAPKEYEIKFKKVDKDNNPLAGASLKVVDSSGNAKDTWTSDTNERTLKLTAGTYKMIEEATPTTGNYKKASDIEFTIKDDGSIEAEDLAVDKTTKTITMVNELKKSSTIVEDEEPTEEPKSEEPKTEEPKSEEPKSEEPKSEEPKSEEPKKPRNTSIIEEDEPNPTTPKPETPVYEELPNPNKPESPDEVIVIDEGGVPLIYKKILKDDGDYDYVEIEEVEVALTGTDAPDKGVATNAKTGDRILIYIGTSIVTGFGLIILALKKRKEF